MPLDSIDEFYILLVEKYSEKRRDLHSQHHNYFNNSKQEVLPAGSLLLLLSRMIKSDPNEPLYLLERVDCDGDQIQVTCKRAEIEKIAQWEIAYIRSIPSLKERLEVFEYKEWLNDGKKLKEGDSVYVKLKDEQVVGIVQFKDVVAEAKGIIFGVELSEPRGSSDGVYKERRYFKTPPSRAIFTPLNKIQIRRDGWSKMSRRRADADSEELYKLPLQPNSQLKLGERVVWMSDDGPNKGTVRWCGVLPDDRSDNITVGVEFDDPIGTGTGKYKDKRLFYTRQSHASLVPMMRLMREEEYEDTTHDLPPQNESQAEFIKQQEQLLKQCVRGGHALSSYPDIRSEGSLVVMPPFLPKSSLPTHFRAECSVDDFHLRHVPVEEVEGYKENSFTRKEHMNDNSMKKENASRLRSHQDFDQELKVDDPVEVKLRDPLYGVIRWIGLIDNKKMAGLEMDKELSGGTDGTYIGQRYFACPPKKALFVPLVKYQRDRRSPVSVDRKQEFEGEPTPEVEGDFPPAEVVSDKHFKEICGKHRGIQGHHNSCYLEASLFCMFYFTTVFDFIYNRPANAQDREEYPRVQRVLREKIVNPLRRFHYVRADNVLELRDLLDSLGTVPGMMGEEKDPEEFMNALLSQIMRADPLLKLSTGEDSFFYQLFMEKDENLLLPTTQKLVELSFLQGNVKLKEVPACFMIQMPRFGKDYKMFHRIVPSLQLDITHILENHPRDCIVCGGQATFECKDCYQVHGPGLNTTAFCDNCVRKSHQHMARRGHKPQRLDIEPAFLDHYHNEMMAMADRDNTVTFEHEFMELFAVICIQTSHYVSFVKCGSGKDAPWVFFDSMADRMGEQGGYNIPEVVHVPEVSKWLSENNFTQLLQNGDDKDLPEHLRRLLCDGYMCMYQSPTVMMFQ